MTLILAALNALAAIPAILKYVEQFGAAVSLWYVQRQTSETLAQIADAAALAGRAQTEDERYAALQRWKDVLSRPRISS